MNCTKSIIWYLLSFPFFLFGCSEDKGSDLGGQTFELTSKDIDCSNDGSYLVPFSGKTYTINVKASENVIWEASVSFGELISITPLGEQAGNGVIELFASENPEKEPGRKSVVTINSSVAGTKRTFTFEQKEKKLYFPDGSENQSTEDFQNISSNYNVHYMREGENVALLWHKDLGLTPSFDADRAVDEADKAFRFLQNELGFASRATNPANLNKFLIFVRNENQNTAYGGGDNGVGKIWLGPNHLINSEIDDRYGILYHEMCHNFQYMAMFDGAPTFGGVGPFYEMTSQFAMIRKFLNWMDLEPYHVNSFMKLSHLALGHEGNQYHSPFVLEYWENIRGPHFIPRMWEEAIEDDNADFVAVYQRLTGLSQEEFNDELFEAYRHFITWDIPSIKDESQNFINKHSCKLKQENKNSYSITPQYCPQNYGYNGIRLQVPNPGTKITLNFVGLFTTNGFKVSNSDDRGWRIGFVAMTKNGERIYSDILRTTNNASTTYEVPENIKDLWLVVMASPTKHRKHIIDSSLGTNQELRIYNQWPYKITLLNTSVDSSFIE